LLLTFNLGLAAGTRKIAERGVTMRRLNPRKVSAKQVEANRRNAKKSTGPCTPQGKLQVCLNALKHGRQADPFVQGMLALQEDPSAYYRLLGDLLASLRPANPHQRLQVEDLARLRMEKQRLQRARAALVAGKRRSLEFGRDRRQLQFDQDSPDLPQAELLQKGLCRAPDSPPKFEKMLSCFDVLISVARQDQGLLDPEPELNLLYGNEPSLEGAYLRNVFRRFVAARGGVGGSEPEVGEPRREGVASDAPRVQRPIQKPSSPIQNGEVEDAGFGVRQPDQQGAGGGARSQPNSAASEGEPERVLLLQTLLAAKQRALRLYQLYNREFVEITSDQREGCLPPSGRTEVNLMRAEAQNDRQLRWALKVYWQTQKEDAARRDRIGARAGKLDGEADEWLEVLEKSLALTRCTSADGGGEQRSWEVLPSASGKDGTAAAGDGEQPLSPTSESNILDEKQSHQVIETTGGVSGIAPNKANLGILEGRGVIVDGQAGIAGAFPMNQPLAINHGKSLRKGSIESARPKVKELLEQMQSDAEARALVETYLLSQMVEEESQREEEELAALQKERRKREALEQGLEQMVAAQQELERRNRRLRAQVGASELMHQQVQEQVKPAEAAVAWRRREPTHQEIYQKIRDVMGLAGPMEYRVESGVEGMPAHHLREEQFSDYLQGRGPAWEEEQRRKR
jgi:hypothetical protein